MYHVTTYERDSGSSILEDAGIQRQPGAAMFFQCLRKTFKGGSIEPTLGLHIRVNGQQIADVAILYDDVFSAAHFGQLDM